MCNPTKALSTSRAGVKKALKPLALPFLLFLELTLGQELNKVNQSSKLQQQPRKASCMSDAVEG